MQIAQNLLAKLDISGWQEFRIGDLFEIYTGRDVIISKAKDGDIPLISHQNTNNGVVKYIEKLDDRILFNHKITISLADRGVFCAFSQNQDFHIGTRVKALVFKNQNITKEIRLFFVVVINVLQIKFTEYSKNATDKLPDLFIRLPIDSKGQPDFAFMENFIKNIEQEHSHKLLKYYKALQTSTLTTNGGGVLSFELEEYLSFCKNKTNICRKTTEIQWKKFTFDSIFTYERGKRYKKADHTSGEIPYISSSAFNNGIDNHVSPPPYMKIYANKLTLANSGSVGTCFYHPYSFVASDHCMVIWLKSRELNQQIALFLRAIFEKLKPKYAFDKEINNTRLRAEKFLLPTYTNGEIAFDFIESFIKALQKEAIKEVTLWSEKELKAYKKVLIERL
ncbi:restriction endonuclease subunit S [uncultured Helicobacter sp.]|uniref:restriction endonuclease subunit S n=1 Tax=uncultured Helicobacter sp. TaxID=175537 RepID=UPI00374F5F74